MDGSFPPRLPYCQARQRGRSRGFAADHSKRKKKGCAHLDVSSYQVRWLFVRLQGDIDGGERPAGHLLHLSQQLLGRGRKKEKKKRVKVSDRKTQTIYSPNQMHSVTPMWPSCNARVEEVFKPFRTILQCTYILFCKYKCCSVTVFFHFLLLQL